MRILFFHRWVGVHYGGTETHVKALATKFSERGHEVSILTRQGTALQDLPPQIKVWRVPKNVFESDFSYEWWLPLYFYTSLFMLQSFLTVFHLLFFRKARFDVISVHFVTEAWVARLLRFLFKIPYVFVLEGYTSGEAVAARVADAAVAISQDETRRVWENHGYRLEYIPVGIDGSNFNSSIDGSALREKYLGDFEKLVISVGRLEKRKDFPTLIAAAKIIKTEGKKYRFLIVGEGIDRQQIESLIKSEKMSDEVLTLGAVSEQEKSRLCRAADLFALATLDEGFGIVLVEAMASGLPVVSTRVGAVPEVVDGAGILVEPRNPQALAVAIEQVLGDQGLSLRLREQAEKIARTYFWENLIGRYEKIYLKALEK